MAPGVPPGVVVESDVMVAMRDGTRLATDVFRPADARGPLPALLERTPYGRRETCRHEHPARSRGEIAAALAAAGYVVAVQDCRGRYGSEGRFEKYLGEDRDGADTLAWLARLPGCDGRVGMHGFSYGAATQIAAASAGAPALHAIIPEAGGFLNAHRSGVRQGGALNLKQVTWAYREALNSPAAARDPAIRARIAAFDIREWIRRLPWRAGESPLAALPEYEAPLLDLWTHAAFDGFWKRAGLWAEGFHDRFPPASGLFLAGWYDDNLPSTVGNYAALARLGRAPQRLIVGPWIHGGRSDSHAGEVEFGPAAPLDGNLAPDYLALRREWFAARLLGAGEARTAPVRLFVMGGGPGGRDRAGRLRHGGAWRDFASWPPPEARPTDFHLHADGRLDVQLPADDSPERRWTHDPDDPVPTIGGAIQSGEPVMVGGAFDQRERPDFFGCRPPFRRLADRPDVLAFETAPLAHALAIAGPVEARLFVASDGPDTDIVLRLIDVHPPTRDDPDGFAMNISGGILRLRWRESWETPRFLAAGEVAAIRVELAPIANLFAVGHRIRLEVASSSFPHFDVNPNTGEPDGLSRGRRVATNALFCRRARPSRLVLPVL
ncbi:MAG: CocE/NonD family hydrolase [Alphaproteobacteria bacterium]|nr:CocE/NonD family hydrolase [Alphaproteobacteria bacterium]